MLVVKNLPANAGDMGPIPRLEDPLEKEMAAHSSILAWKNSMDNLMVTKSMDSRVRLSPGSATNAGLGPIT